MCGLGESPGHDVFNHVGARAEVEIDCLCSNNVTDKTVLNINIFRTSMIFGVMRKWNRSLVVSVASRHWWYMLEGSDLIPRYPKPEDLVRPLSHSPVLGLRSCQSYGSLLFAPPRYCPTSE